MGQTKLLTLRVLGFAISLVLTLIAYFIMIYPEFFYLKSSTAILTILLLAALQSIVQFVFFLHLKEKEYWNSGVFMSTLGIIFIIVFFSIWIMDNLNYNMKP